MKEVGKHLTRNSIPKMNWMVTGSACKYTGGWIWKDSKQVHASSTEIDLLITRMDFSVPAVDFFNDEANAEESSPDAYM